MEGAQVKFILVIVVVLSVIFISLIATSFVDVEYYQFGFKRYQLTGAVDTSEPLRGGRYATGPGYAIKPFLSTAHTVDLNSVAVFASDRLEIQLSASFQYFVKFDSLKLLHDTYDIQYDPIVITNGQDALKAAATHFATKEFFQNRTYVEEELFKAVQLRLNGICCLPDCQDACVTGCKLYDTCGEEDKGLFVDMRYFQLTLVVIPEDISDRFLTTLVTDLNTEESQFKQDADVVDKETEQQIQNITNLANEVLAEAVAEASLTEDTSLAEVASVLEEARRVGLRRLYSGLNITSQEHKSSYDYLRTLTTMKTAHISVDFDQLIRGNL